MRLPNPTEDELMLLTLGQHLDPEDRAFIAHTFNNPLTPVGALLSELRGELEDGMEPDLQTVENALASYERLRRAVVALTAQCWYVTLGDDGCRCERCKRTRL